MVKKTSNFDYRINLRCTSEDKLAINEKAKQAGKDVSEYLRNLALNKNMYSITDLKSFKELNRIGGNINQIARKINSSTVINNPDDILKKLDEIRNELEQIKVLLNIKL